jgi:hypothetical protein
MSHDVYLINLDVSPELEDVVVDCLLMIEHLPGFSSYLLNVHDLKHNGMSLAEQVSGRQKKVRFQVQTERAGVAVIVNRLKSEFSGSGLKYSVLPIIESGEI